MFPARSFPPVYTRHKHSQFRSHAPATKSSISTLEHQIKTKLFFTWYWENPVSEDREGKAGLLPVRCGMWRARAFSFGFIGSLRWFRRSAAFC